MSCTTYLPEMTSQHFTSHGVASRRQTTSLSLLHSASSFNALESPPTLPSAPQGRPRPPRCPKSRGAASPLARRRRRGGFVFPPRGRRAPTSATGLVRLFFFQEGSFPFIACRGCPSPSQDSTDLFRQDANAHGDEVVTGLKLLFRMPCTTTTSSRKRCTAPRNESLTPSTTSLPCAFA